MNARRCITVCMMAGVLFVAATTAALATDNGFVAAQQVVTQYEAVHAFTPIPKLPKTPSKHYTIDVLTCPIPACQQTTAGAVSAAKALGWKVKYVTYQLTPTGYVSAFSNIAQSPPDGLFYIMAFPNSTIASQLATLHAHGTKIVVDSPQTPVSLGPKIDAILQGPPEFRQGGQLAADAVVADARKTTDAAVVTDPAYGVFIPAAQGFKATVKQRCPACGVSTLDISLANPAAQTDATVTSYLRQNPSVKYLFFTIGDAVAGLPGALSAAGISGVKIVSMTPDLSNIADIKAGSEWATIQIENATSGYRGVDALARLSIGETVGPESDPAGYARIITQKNVVAGRVPTTPGTPGAFLKAWGV